MHNGITIHMHVADIRTIHINSNFVHALNELNKDGS